MKKLLAISLVLAATAYAADALPPVGKCFNVRGQAMLTANVGPVLDSKTDRFYLSGMDHQLLEKIFAPLREPYKGGIKVAKGTYRVCREPNGENQFGVMHMVSIKSVVELSFSQLP